MELISDSTGKGRRELVLLILIVIVLLSLFINKPFNIDDTLFLWNAKHIQTDLTDFYGFNANWYGSEMPMHQITKNPPLVPYIISAFAFLFGWSEVSLHILFLIPAAGTIAGTYMIARKLCGHPFAAAMAAFMSPVFFVSSSTVMCDVTMLCFWVWAIYLWITGIEEGNDTHLLLSSVLIALASLTKYFGISLIPLLLVHTLISKRKFIRGLLYLLIPIAVLGLYQYYTYSLYGKGLLSDAAAYASNFRQGDGSRLTSKTIAGLSFTGWCMIASLFCLPFIWDKKVTAVYIVFFAAGALLLPELGKIGGFVLAADGNVKWGWVLQVAAASTAGLSIICLSLYEMIRKRDSLSFLLFFWIAGTFFFAVFLNWSVNGRSVLPMVPAVGILILRQIESRDIKGVLMKYIWIPLLLSGLISLLVTFSDHSLARTAKTAASEIHEKYSGHGSRVWFQGHWGFQYYMEEHGFNAVDIRKPGIMPGDIVVVPSNNTNIYPMDRNASRLIDVIKVTPFKWLTTMSHSQGAGFYADVWGPMPFVFGSVPDEQYFVYQMY